VQVVARIFIADDTFGQEVTAYPLAKCEYRNYGDELYLDVRDIREYGVVLLVVILGLWSI
jgi:hypothetical protein